MIEVMGTIWFGNNISRSQFITERSKSNWQFQDSQAGHATPLKPLGAYSCLCVAINLAAIPSFDHR